MLKVTLYKDEYLVIEYSEEGQYLVHTWQGFTSYETFCTLIDKAINFMKEKKAKGFIIDSREHRGIGTALQEYAAQKTTQFEQENYPIKQALVIPENIFSRLSVENYSQKVRDKLDTSEIAYFDNLEDAEAWMMQNERQ